MRAIRNVATQLLAACRDADERPQGPASRRDHMVTALFASVVVLGAIVDGWSHINLRQGKLGPFLTPWHGILYAGVTMTVLWILSRNQRPDGWRVNAVPAGYGLALVGMGLTMVAVTGDAIWHTVFGDEVNLSRLLSPFHLVLFTGTALLVVCPFRALWISPESSRTPTRHEFLPALLSLTLVTILLGFCTQFASPFVTWLTEPVERLARASAFQQGDDIVRIFGVLLTTLLLMAPMLLVLRRWRPPFGTAILMFTSVSVTLSALTEFRRGATIPAALLGGLVTDLLIARHRSAPDTRLHRTVAFFTPLVLWGAMFGVLAGVYGITWVPELWLGSLAVGIGSSVLLSVLMVPTAIPGVVRLAVVNPERSLAWPVQAHNTTDHHIGPARHQGVASHHGSAKATMAPFLQELAHVVEAGERARDANDALEQARPILESLRLANERLGVAPVMLPSEQELIGLEARIAGHRVKTEIVDDAQVLLTAARRGLPIDGDVEMILHDLVARAEKAGLTGGGEPPRDLRDAAREATTRAPVATRRRISADQVSA